MKKMIFATLIAVIVIMTSMPAFAKESASAPNMILDVVVLRPFCFAYMVICTAGFVVALPFAITSGTVKPVAQSLVAFPFELTFGRPLGDYSDFEP